MMSTSLLLAQRRLQLWRCLQLQTRSKSLWIVSTASPKQPNAASAFDRLVQGRLYSATSTLFSPKTAAISFTTKRPYSAAGGGKGESGSSNGKKKGEKVRGKHPDAEKEPLPEWPDGVNPHTGERGGPKGPEPTRYGDWERKGRVTDF